jgi:hypothetical protein
VRTKDDESIEGWVEFWSFWMDGVEDQVWDVWSKTSIYQKSEIKPPMGRKIDCRSFGAKKPLAKVLSLQKHPT